MSYDNSVQAVKNNLFMQSGGKVNSIGAVNGRNAEAVNQKGYQKTGTNDALMQRYEALDARERPPVVSNRIIAIA